VKILHVIPGLSPLFGGPSKTVLEMCRALQGRGFEVAVATTDTDVRGNISIPLGYAVTMDDVTVWCFRCPLLRKYGFSLGLTQWLAEHIKDYDLLHIHAFFSYITAPTASYGRKRGVPYIIRPLGQLDPWCIDHGAWKKRLFNWLVGQSILKGASAIHVTSEMEWQSLVPLGFAEKSVIIPLGIDTSSLSALPMRRESSARVPRLLFLSRLDPIKGLPLLFQAVRQLADQGTAVELTVAGSGEPMYMKEMQALVHRLALERRVDFVGFLTGQEKLRCFTEADVFVLPSYHENFAVAVAEAMAAGLPVIVSNRVALAKEVEEVGAGLVIPSDTVDALAQAIRELVTNRGAREAMGNRGRSLIAQRFTWLRTGEQLADLYRVVAQG
jgi:glycosyltransferase involved in cell wall biosynthesis